MIRRTRGEALVLTHRQELKQQHETLLKNLAISNARVAMILTEASRLGQYEKPALIITDEAHLSRSNSWMKVLDYYDTYTVGFTATPVRLDGKPLGDIYDELVTGVSVQWLIDHHRLAPFEYYAPTVVETEGLRLQAGDYVVKDLEQLMTERAIYGDVIKSYQRFAPGERSIVYCVSVKHARETADAFNSAGIRAEFLSAGTDAGRRQQIMEDFRRGKFTVLCNVGIISEGVSIDEVSCCILLRPTESLALYWQQGMRCMRYQPGKVAKIIDCVGNYTRNPLFDADVEWSLNQSLRKRSALNSEGDFHIRSCPKCFKVFKTAPICPYCGHQYPLHPREIKAHQEIELVRITAEQAAEAERKRKEARRAQGKARTFPELVAIGRERGYSNPAAWASMVMRGRR
jgi:superfamily II DNA or RNA helicase